jgi:hypothetical protein
MFLKVIFVQGQCLMAIETPVTKFAIYGLEIFADLHFAIA